MNTRRNEVDSFSYLVGWWKALLLLPYCCFDALVHQQSCEGKSLADNGRMSICSCLSSEISSASNKSAVKSRLHLVLWLVILRDEKIAIKDFNSERTILKFSRLTSTFVNIRKSLFHHRFFLTIAKWVEVGKTRVISLHLNNHSSSMTRPHRALRDPRSRVLPGIRPRRSSYRTFSRSQHHYEWNN